MGGLMGPDGCGGGGGGAPYNEEIQYYYRDTADTAVENTK